MAAAPPLTPDDPCWRGEMRSGARANVLMGVASARIDIKQAAGRAETLLERYAEPLSALHVAPERWPAPFLALAWRKVVENTRTRLDLRLQHRSGRRPEFLVQLAERSR